MDWNYIQENSDKILMQGILKLKNQPCVNWSQIHNDKQGNYLISKDEILFYIGEGKSLSKRLKQQFLEKTTTFYKTYKKMEFGNEEINSFEVRVIETNLGRKEIEEFGIVSLPTVLNKFQKGKCKKYNIIEIPEFDWDRIQKDSEKLLFEGEKYLFEQPSQEWFNAVVPDNAGVYMVFDNNDKIIYIGESSNLFERYTTHSETTYFSALRRHIGTVLLNLKFVQIKSKKKDREFLEEDDLKITEFYKKCKVKFLPVNIGRYELEEFLIRKYRPVLNRKENK